MLQYLIKRFLWMFPILLGVNLITFALFFVVNKPDDIARVHLGQKYLNPQAIEDYKRTMGYDKPLLWNEAKPSFEKITETIFFQKSIKLFVFEFGSSDAGRDIVKDISERMWPSLYIAVPAFLLGLWLNISIALCLSLLRNTLFDKIMMVGCVILMSISTMFYIIGMQFIFSKAWQWFPIAGYAPGWKGLSFLWLPILVSIFSGLGGGVRWYRALFLEELSKEYVRTLYAKGLHPLNIIFKHVLKNAAIPILTGVVVIIPLLFMGSLLVESFFSIPGLGSYTIDAILQQDFAIVRVMVFLGCVLYVIGLWLTDISYAVVDPRVRLQEK